MLHLTVIAKEPVPGAVKTRLCPPLDAREAAALAAAALGDTFDAVAMICATRTDVRPVALVDGARGDWIPAGFTVVAQRGDGLGARLAAGFDDLGPGVIVGMDTPGGLVHLDAMADAVAGGIDTLGLTVDGGYWAIGLAGPSMAGRYATVFDEVPMSTGRTGIAQLRRLHALGRRARLAPMVHDLDRIEDVAQVVGEAPHGRLADLVRSLELPAV
jgi:glycosyltransferase A (GT-A) superfamily protein (DUF2064 family)